MVPRAVRRASRGPAPSQAPADESDDQADGHGSREQPSAHAPRDPEPREQKDLRESTEEDRREVFTSGVPAQGGEHPDGPERDGGPAHQPDRQERGAAEKPSERTDPTVAAEPAQRVQGQHAAVQAQSRRLHQQHGPYRDTGDEQRPFHPGHQHHDRLVPEREQGREGAGEPRGDQGETGQGRRGRHQEHEEEAERPEEPRPADQEVPRPVAPRAGQGPPQPRPGRAVSRTERYSRSSPVLSANRTSSDRWSSPSLLVILDR